MPYTRRARHCPWCGQVCKGTCPRAVTARAERAAMLERQAEGRPRSEGDRLAEDQLVRFWSEDPETRERAARELFG